MDGYGKLKLKRNNLCNLLIGLSAIQDTYKLSSILRPKPMVFGKKYLPLGMIIWDLLKKQYIVKTLYAHRKKVCI